jgi:putative peptidoglycan lipid II flippase
VSLVPVAALAGEVVACLVLAWFAIRIVGMRIKLGFSRPPALVRFAKLVSAEVGGSAVTRVNPVVDQLMAGLSLVVGGGTMLRYSGDIASLPTSLLQASLLPVLLSHLADDFAAGDLHSVRRTVTRALAAVMGLLVAMTAILYAVRAPLLRLVFLRGEMDAAGVDRMIQILPYHLVGLAPFGALLVLARAHVALKNSTIMLSMGMINTGCNALFNMVLLEVIGLEGIALSTSCVQAAVAVVFWFRFEARLRVLQAGVARVTA